MIRTTKINLKGDIYRADTLALAHVDRLLHIFRTNTDFQKLKINTYLENFFDSTGQFIGSIHLSTNWGIEVVTVNVLSGKKKITERTEMQDMIVPLIRSTDNKYWVACLSGTFEGPYYAFENIQEITAEEMDDNAESELDGRMIATGTSPLNGADSPQLFFIAQSGIRPEESDIGSDTSEFPNDDSEFNWKPWSLLEVSEQKEFISAYEAICCSVIGYATLESVVKYRTDYSYKWYTTVYDERLQYQASEGRSTLNLDATFHMSQVFYSPGACESTKEAILFDWENDVDDIFEFTYLPGSGYVSDSAAVETWNELNTISFVDAASFAASHRITERDAQIFVHLEY